MEMLKETNRKIERLNKKNKPFVQVLLCLDYFENEEEIEKAYSAIAHGLDKKRGCRSFPPYECVQVNSEGEIVSRGYFFESTKSLHGARWFFFIIPLKDYLEQCSKRGVTHKGEHCPLSMFTYNMSASKTERIWNLFRNEAILSVDIAINEELLRMEPGSI